MLNITDNTPCVRYTANGDTTVFPFNFAVPNNSWVKVQWLQPSAVATTEVPQSAYTINDNSVIFQTPPSADTLIIISPSAPNSPSQDKAAQYAETTPLVSAYLSDAIDKMVQEGHRVRKELQAIVEHSEQLRDDAKEEISILISNFTHELANKEHEFSNLIKTRTIGYETTVDKINKELKASVDKYFQNIQESSTTLTNSQSDALNKLEEQVNKALTDISTEGKNNLDTFIKSSNDAITKITDLYQSKYKELNDYQIKLQQLPTEVQAQATEKANTVYSQFIDKLNITEQTISNILTTATDDIKAVAADTENDLKKWNERAITSLDQATAEAIKEITAHGETICDELDKLIADFRKELKDTLTSFGIQVEQCVEKAKEFAQAAVEAQCEAEQARDSAEEFKNLAYSAAGTKGWLLYRTKMPATVDEIAALHEIVNDGSLVIAGGSDPEDGGGNPTGGTDTEDFWCMVKTVEAYQKVVEQLLSDLTPDDVANLKSYFDILTKVLNNLQDMQVQLNSFHLTDTSLSERITRNSHGLTILYSLINAQREQLDLLTNGMADLAEITDKAIEKAERDSNQKYNELREEHNRMGFLITQLEKRVANLENRRARRA